jgi:hypothetical protein
METADFTLWREMVAEHDLKKLKRWGRCLVHRFPHDHATRDVLEDTSRLRVEYALATLRIATPHLANSARNAHLLQTDSEIRAQGFQLSENPIFLERFEEGTFVFDSDLERLRQWYPAILRLEQDHSAAAGSHPVFMALQLSEAAYFEFDSTRTSSHPSFFTRVGSS